MQRKKKQERYSKEPKVKCKKRKAKILLFKDIYDKIYQEVRTAKYLHIIKERGKLHQAS
jgi:hypothetical protein